MKLVLVSLCLLLASCHPSSLEQKLNPDLKPFAELIDKKSDRILVEGTVSALDRLHVSGAGSLHVRLVDLDRAARAVLFHHYEHVHLPFKYTIFASDYISANTLAELYSGHYYVEAFFNLEKTKGPRSQSLFGEGWGAAGRPYPLHLGDKKNIQLTGWWTPEVLGQDPSEDEKFPSGWVYISFPTRHEIKSLMNERANIVLCGVGRRNGPLARVAVTMKTGEEPVPWSIPEPKLLAERGYMVGWITAESPQGEKFVLYGTSGSKKVTINFNFEKIALSHYAKLDAFEPCRVF